LAIATFRIKVGQQWHTVEIGDLSSSPVEVTVDGETFQVEVETQQPAPGPGAARSRPRPGQRAAPRANASATRSASQSDGIVRSPMPGRVISIMVRPGDQVAAGDELCVVEAMKMEQSIRAARSGIIKTIHVQPMDSVSANDPLMELE